MTEGRTKFDQFKDAARSDMLSDDLAGWVYPLGLLSLLSVPAIWAYQILHWLRFGEWDAIPVSEGLGWLGFDRPRFSWRGVQQVSDWIMSIPLSLFLFFLILGLLVLFSEWGDRRDRAARKAAVSS